MAETKPRELTTAELELLKAPAQHGGDSAPLTVPPGTQVPVHLLDPHGDRTASDDAEPTASPPSEDG